MKSMTGYGAAEYQDEKIHIILEMKSYNNRYLDIIINQPAFLNGLEPEFRKYISDNSERGRVELYIKIRELEEDIVFHPDKAAAASYAESLRELSAAAGLDEKLSLAHLLSFEGLLKTEKKRDIDEYREKINPLLAKCVAEWNESRKKEGHEAVLDIKSKLESLYEAVELFESNASVMEENIKSNIRMRFNEILGSEVDEQRILTETAVMLVKYSINEEIVRLKGHLDTFTAAMYSGEAVGKKLDFICQEINREVNTIGSKSFIMDVSQRIVEAKDNLENIREQLRNVE